MHTLHHQPRGFTLIEISLTLLISGILIVLVTANYRRANQDSLLQREASLLISRLRLAQEETAAGLEVKFQRHITGQQCFSNTQCWSNASQAYTASCTCCPILGDAACDSDPTKVNHVPIVPEGGLALAFSCQSSSFADETLFLQGSTKYFFAADRTNCFRSDCYPFGYPSGTYGTPPSDKIISFYREHYKGDTQLAAYKLGKGVVIKDIRMTLHKAYPAVGGKTQFVCADRTPWKGKSISDFTGANTGKTESVPANYPLGGSLRYIPPDGRSLVIADHVAPWAPADTASNEVDRTNPWDSMEIMLALEDRSTASCRVVKVTNSNVVTQNTDADCNFATPN